MSVRKTQQGGNPYNEGFAMPVDSKGKSDINRINLLESKIALLSKLIFEKSKIYPAPLSGLSIKKTLVYGTNLNIELVNNAFFAPGANLTIHTYINSKTTDTNYFARSVTLRCNRLGLFPRRPLILTTLYMEKPDNYQDMRLTVVVQDKTKQHIFFLEADII